MLSNQLQLTERSYKLRINEEIHNFTDGENVVKFIKAEK